MSRIVQLANFVTPSSGGLRTALVHLAEGYARAGHDVVQVVPGPRAAREQTAWGCRRTLPASEVPGTGYRLLVDRGAVLRQLDELAPDRVEVHDRTTLRGVGPWAAGCGVPSLVVSHERLDRWLKQWLPARLPLDRWADRSNAMLAASFDDVVCTTAWAAQEFSRLGVSRLRRVPLGVDLEAFRPDRSARPHPSARESRSAGDEVLLVMASRLAKEKRPDLAVEATRELLRRGVPARLVVAGDGPLRSALSRQAYGLPVEFLGFVQDRHRLAGLLGSADVVVAPGPVETFGLAALEALACGTPVVANAHSALPEVLGDAGRAAASVPRCIADAVQELLAVPVADRRLAARRRAEQFPWSATVESFLRAHALPVGPLPGARVQQAGIRAV
ncbi:MAG: glycosyltransferase [Mycobacteriales bacterium]